jgi:hypothetical protein
MALDYLQLVQKLHRDVGAAGVQPSAVTGLTGEALRLAGWIQDADADVQDLYENWKFLRNTFTTANLTTDGIATLAAPANLTYWDFNTFKIRPAGIAVGQEYPIQSVEYDTIKSRVLDITTNIPDLVIVMPDGSLQFEQVPNGAHTILADYYVDSEENIMTANTDNSVIPAAYRKVILGRAMILYANFEGAAEIKTQGTEIYTEFLARLENNQLPNQKHARFNTGARIEVIGGQGGFGDDDSF